MPNPIPRSPLQPKYLIIDLDIDNTIVNELALLDSPHLNTGLINALKESGITYINLFSMTEHKDISNYLMRYVIPEKECSFTRIDLVKALEQTNLIVEQMLFPIDILNKETVESTYEGNVSWKQWKKYVDNVEEIARLIKKLYQNNINNEELLILQNLTNTFIGSSEPLGNIFQLLETNLLVQKLEYKKLSDILKDMLFNSFISISPTTNIDDFIKLFYLFASKYVLSKSYYKLYNKPSRQLQKGDLMEIRLNAIRLKSTPTTFLFADDKLEYLKQVVNKIDPKFNKIDVTGSKVYKNGQLAIIPYLVKEQNQYTERMEFNSTPYLKWIKNGLNRHYHINKYYIKSTLSSLSNKDGLDIKGIQNNILQPIFDLQDNFASNMPPADYIKYVAVIETIAETISNLTIYQNDNSVPLMKPDFNRLEEVIETLQKENTNTVGKKILYILLDIIEFLMQEKYPIFFKEQRKWVKTLKLAEELNYSLSI